MKKITIDEDFQGSYVFWVPCTQWGASMDEVKTYMKSQSGWKMNYEMNGMNITYTHKQTGMEVYYSLKNGKLYYANLKYINCEQEFDHACNDWAQAFHFTWDESFTAYIESLDCSASIGVVKMNESVKMEITLRHSFDE